MSTSRRPVTLALLFGAVVFGMVLAGTLDLTPAGLSAPAPQAPISTPTPTPHMRGFADLAEAVSPAVVTIDAATIEKGTRRGGPGGGMNPFEFFFGPQGPRNPHGQGQGDDEDGGGNQEFRSDAGGTGFVISPDGLVVTNYHVIEGATTINVHLDRSDYKAEVKGTDPATDLALLKITSDQPFKYLKLGDSDALRVGDWVMAIGNPLLLERTVTVGVVSAKGRSIGISDTSFENFIQTDAAINRGNSGGPLVNVDGEVVGIATAMNWGAENIGFAVPVSTLKEVLPQLREKGRVSRGYLGIRVGNITAQQKEAFGLSTTDGALVQSVDSDTPADKAGVQHGDVILGVDEKTVRETRDLINYVSAKGPGADVTLHILRDGKKIDRKVHLEERPGLDEEQEPTKSSDEGSGIDWLGLRFQDLSPGLKSMHGVPAETRGVWVSDISPSSPLYDEAIRPGDVITEVNGTKVQDAAGFRDAVKGAKSGSFLRLYVERYDPRANRPTQFFAVVRVP